MTITYFPFDAGSGANVQESQWSEMARLWRTTGVVPLLDGQSLNALEVYGDSSGMLVKVKSGEAWIKGHYIKNSAVLSVALSASDPSNARIDVIVAEVDWVNNTMDITVVEGTPAGSPAVPALTTTDGTLWQISLAQVTVDAGASVIAAGKVTDTRSYCTDNLGVISVVVGDGTNAITTGIKGYIPCPCKLTFTSWQLLADASGSIVIDVHKCTYSGFPTTASISGTDKPTLSSVQKNTSSALTGWTTAFNLLDVFEINVDSATTVKQVTLSLFYVKG